MAEDTNKQPGPFHVATVKALIQLMSRHDMSEIDLRNGDQRIRLVRGGSVVAAPPAAPIPVAPPPAATAAPAASTEPAEKTEPKEEKKTLHEIKSPTPGTFYSRPNPDAEPYVKVGSRVTPETVVCLIEAMKLFTEITADVNGVITEILVQDGQPVEYGTVLFRVDTSA